MQSDLRRTRREQTRSRPSGGESTGHATVVFADLVGFTSLTEVHGDLVATDVLDVFHDVVENHAGRFGMRTVKNLGDAFLLTCRDPGAALSFGLAILSAMDSKHARLAGHVGVHAGPVITRGGDVFGRTVNLAARLATRAPADTVLFTEAVHRAISVPGDFVPLAYGRQRLKGIPEPVELYGLRLPRPLMRVTDPVCRMKIPRAMALRTMVLRRTYHFCSEKCARAFAERPLEFLRSPLRRHPEATPRRPILPRADRIQSRNESEASSVTDQRGGLTCEFLGF